MSAATIAACLLGRASTAGAQGVEIAPFGGYRFGGDFFEIVTRQAVDVDGAPAVGLVVDVPLSDGLQVEGLFTHQAADVVTPTGPLPPLRFWRITVDQWLGGGLQEFGQGRVRPFLTGLLGLTRYATEGDSEFRFNLATGGGVKLFPSSHLGLRLESRLSATFDDANTRLVVCSPGPCLFSINAYLVWQWEFTAGLVVRLP